MDVLSERGTLYRGEPGFSAARAVRRAPPPPPPRIVVPVDPGDGFPLGAMVRHPMFGSGRILDREGKGIGLKLTIHFVGYGPKKILPAYTQLEVLGG